MFLMHSTIYSDQITGDIISELNYLNKGQDGYNVKYSKLEMIFAFKKQNLSFFFSLTCEKQIKMLKRGICDSQCVKRKKKALSKVNLN